MSIDVITNITSDSLLPIIKSSFFDCNYLCDDYWRTVNAKLKPSSNVVDFLEKKGEFEQKVG